MLEKFKKDKYLWGLAVIVLVVIFVRGWMFSDLLTFKMDQARDIKLVEEAYKAGNGKPTLEGLGELPLLGPRAAKTYLRLGPIFYYFEYISLLIFGDHPWSVAVPDFIFSVLTIPLFYYFLRQAFNKKISLLTTAVFASSFFLNQYGRFAWNPNSIPFWSLLYFLGLYKLVHGSGFMVHGSKLSVNNSGKWLLVATIGYGVASQLHFTAMLAYPLIGILFVSGAWFLRRYLGNYSNKVGGESSFKFKILNLNSIFNELISNFKNKKSDKNKIKNNNRILSNFSFNRNLKYLLGAVAILGIMYLPMALSEICTHGDNWVQFKYALSGRGKEEFPLKMKIIQSLKLHSEYFWFTLTSWGGGEGKWGVLGFIMIIGGLFLSTFYTNLKFKIQNLNSPSRRQARILNKLILNFKKERNSKGKTTGKRQLLNNSNWLFFLLIWIWFGVMFLLYTKLAFNVIKPRYWLLEAPIFYVALAVVLNMFSQIKSFIGRWLPGVLSIVLIGMNLWATGNWYWELSQQQDSKLFIWDLKLKDENKIPWGQLQKTADYIEGLSNQTEKDICFYATGEYRPVYDYIFDKRGLSEKVRRISFKNDSNENCLFITIDHHQHRDIPRLPKDHRNEFQKTKKQEIGFVTVWQVSRIKNEKLDRENKEKEKKQEKKDQQAKSASITNSPIDNAIQNNANTTKTQQKTLATGKNKQSNSTEETAETEIKDISTTKDKIKKPRRVERVRWKDILACFSK